MDDALTWVAFGAVMLVLLILLAGLGSFIKGGDLARRHSNRLMRWRLGAQAVAILLILAIVLIRQSRG
jgi:hypothetical protein